MTQQLPQVNKSVKFTTTMPSTGKPLTFRPFLVGEEKILLIAKEAGDNASLLRATVDVLDACYDLPHPAVECTLFDVEYLFLQLRAKSVGEKETLGLQCESCSGVVNVPFDFEQDVQLSTKVEAEYTVKLNDEFALTLRYPTVQDVIDINMDESAETASGWAILLACLKTLATEQGLYDFRDYDTDAKDAFLSGLTEGQLQKLQGFVETFPKVQASVPYVCEHCGNASSLSIEGLAGFFG